MSEPSQTLTAEAAAALGQFYRQHLAGQMLPFWLRGGSDEEYGGYFTGFSNDGRRLLHRLKFTWSQGRFVWLWARLAAQLSDHPDAGRFLALARSGADFLRHHALLDNGHVAFILSREGQPVVLGSDGAARPAQASERYDTSTYADCYVVYGLSEFARVAHDEQSFRFALDLFGTVERRYRAGEFRTDPYPTPAGYKAHGVPMFLLETARELAVTADGFDGAAAAPLRRLAGECAHEVMAHHHQADGTIIELLGSDNRVRETLLGTYVNPGLMFQDMWFVMHYAAACSDRGLIEQAAATVRRACELGWDGEYGGLLQFVHRGGGRPSGAISAEEQGHPMLANLAGNWDGKFYWVHTEALYALLLAYYHTRQPWALEWYWRVHDYTFATFPAPGTGEEWINLRQRDGTPSTAAAAVPVKDPFHAPRNMLLILRLLERMAESA
ncbi:MAG: AGE family epimerase/isomerase [Anaerolineae bacterium]